MDRRDVVAQAVEILRKVGLPDLTMRRLGTELGVQQSALYHHFPNKQALLGAVADEILRRGPQRELDPAAPWEQQLQNHAEDLRSALLAYPDGADVVSSMFAFGLGGANAEARMRATLEGAGWSEQAARPAVRTLLHFVHGHAVAQQAHDAASKLGAIASRRLDPDHEFAVGLAIVLSGISASPRG